jgi:hypothetical protein
MQWDRDESQKMRRVKGVLRGSWYASRFSQRDVSDKGLIYKTFVP